MSQSRDRLTRPVDIGEMFARQRRLMRENGGVDRENGGGANLFATPRPVTRETTTTPMAVTRIGRIGRGRVGTSRFGNAAPRGRSGGAAVTVRRENNNNNRSWARGVLPSWYPRTPLRDITHIVRAIERRNARLREIEGRGSQSPSPQDENIQDQSAPSAVAPLEHNNEKVSMVTPNPSVSVKVRASFAGKVPKIRLGFTDENNAESELLTPQKKLLNSIDTVEKVVLEKLEKLKRTPSARKAERERKIRTLMSMR